MRRFLFVILLGTSSFAQVVGASYRSLRYTHVVGQTDWYTCGAVVATLLTHYYGDPTTEEEVLKVAISAGAGFP
ncbi:hypothetical protein [Thermus thermophilus]|uniref:hypothetical protein n=1 Tax=Thermus thermophilus TaxID=274 RepID=UPI001FAE90EE